MPRKSAAALSVVPATFPKRPEPPADLTAEQAVEWRAVVATMPVDWFTPETWPLLIAYCRHTVTARTVAKLLETTDPGKDLARYDLLSRIGVRQSNILVTLATKMRLTHTGRYRVEKRVPVTAASHKPWDGA
jgi:hypothetical protein